MTTTSDHADHEHFTLRDAVNMIGAVIGGVHPATIDDDTAAAPARVAATSPLLFHTVTALVEMVAETLLYVRDHPAEFDRSPDGTIFAGPVNAPAAYAGDILATLIVANPEPSTITDLLVGRYGADNAVIAATTADINATGADPADRRHYGLATALTNEIGATILALSNQPFDHTRATAVMATAGHYFHHHEHPLYTAVTEALATFPLTCTGQDAA